MKQNKGIVGLGLIVAIVLGIVVVGGGAYFLGKGSNKQEVKSPENVFSTIPNQNLPVVEDQKTNTATPTTLSGDIKLLSFKAVDGNFVVETDHFNEHALIRVFADPTGTGIRESDPMTNGAFLGTMKPVLDGEKVKWTLSGDSFKNKMTNNLYATLYLNGNASKSIKFPKEGAFVYEDIFGKN